MGGDVVGLVLVTVLFVAAALLVQLVMRRAARGTLGPNHVAGMRTTATMSSPEAWRAAHEAAKGWTDVSTVVGIVLAVAGAVTAGLGATGWAAGLILAASLVLLAGAIGGGVKGHRVARSVRDGS